MRVDIRIDVECHVRGGRFVGWNAWLGLVGTVVVGFFERQECFELGRCRRLGFHDDQSCGLVRGITYPIDLQCRFHAMPTMVERFAM